MNCVVSGASSGIGKEICKYLVSKGHKVLAIARREELLLSLKESLQQEAEQSEIRNQQSERDNSETESRPRSRFLSEVEGSAPAQLSILQADLSDHSSLNKLAPILKDWGQVDLIINNAGALINKSFIDTTPEDFILQYQSNVITAVNLVQACDPYLKEGSHIVNISSMGGYQGSSKYAGLSAYSSAKGALSILTECLDEEYRSRGVSANALALGAVQTEMLAEAFPGFEAGTSASEMAQFVSDFAIESGRLMSGKVIPVAKGNP